MTPWMQTFFDVRMAECRGRVINERARAGAMLVETMVMITRVPQTERYVRRALDARLAKERAHLENLQELEKVLP
jgi:hypothetical protein